MMRDTVKVGFEEGLETRNMAMLVQTAGRYKSNIHIRAEAYEVNAKSIMGVMTLGLNYGDEVELLADGPDETEAMEALKAFLSCGKE